MGFASWATRRRKIADTPWWLQQGCDCSAESIRVYPIDNDYDVPSASVAWNQVTPIVAFKVDLLTTDLICCAITDGREIVTVNEEMPAWTTAMTTLESVFGSAIQPNDWYAQVMLPAFAENRMTIYARP
jgi:hypothetical protein